MNTAAKLDPRAIRRGFLEFYAECGGPVESLVACEHGVADVVTDQFLLQLGPLENWLLTLGQSIAMATELSLYPEVGLYGDGDYESILELCTQMRVCCYGLTIQDGNAERFVRCIGAPTHSNHEQVKAWVENRHAIFLN